VKNSATSFKSYKISSRFFRGFFRNPRIAYHIIKALSNSDRPLTAYEVAKIINVTHGKATSYLRDFIC